MKLYVFKNKLDNYCTGKFHFFAMNDGEAKTISERFEKKHNKDVDMVKNYLVDLELVKSIPATTGFVEDLR